MSQYKDDAVMYLYHKALADKSKSTASLELMLDHPAGIGDHSTDDLYAELDKALDILVDAEDRLDILDTKYSQIIDRHNRRNLRGRIDNEPPF